MCKKVEVKEFEEAGTKYRITARMRFDDECKNGHNTFSITGDLDVWERGRWQNLAGGCIHDEIAKHFPHLQQFIKWHLCSTDGPMHYIANTVYHASDKDHHGLRKGERKQLRNGKTNMPVWQRVMRDGQGNIISDGSGSWLDAAEPPVEMLIANWEPVWIVGEGKARELGHARSSAVWPEATDAELMADDLADKLRERLPQLLKDFQAAMESLGFEYK